MDCTPSYVAGELLCHWKLDKEVYQLRQGASVLVPEQEAREIRTWVGTAMAAYLYLICSWTFRNQLLAALHNDAQRT